jgi:hypothetical protein
MVKFLLPQAARDDPRSARVTAAVTIAGDGRPQPGDAGGSLNF